MAIEIFPKAEVWIKAGKCYEKRKEFELACKDYQKAVDLDSAFALGHLRLGWAMVRNGDRDKGLEILKQQMHCSQTTVKL